MHCLLQLCLALAFCAVLAPSATLAERRQSYRLGLRSAGRLEDGQPEGRFTSSIANKFNLP
ncbi:GL19936 [Drosophila persimilis]|uniref:GL19936 n=1 Tax=Drosophila persimilis TaxID=7234 RepID=B4GYK3_DROPE|nr:GL19936 [Drosophila persimilis]